MSLLYFSGYAQLEICLEEILMVIDFEIFPGAGLGRYQKKNRLTLKTKKRKKRKKRKLWFLACLPNLVRCVKNGLPPGRDSWSTLLFIQV